MEHTIDIGRLECKCSLNLKVLICEEGHHPPNVVEKYLEGSVISVKSKPMKDWTQAKKVKARLNAKAKNSLFCALSPKEFNRLVNCTHEGTSQVKSF